MMFAAESTHMATSITGIRPVGAQHQTRIDHHHAHVLAITEVEFLFVKEAWHIPLVGVSGLLKLKIIIEIAIVVAANSPHRQIFQVIALKKRHYGVPFLVSGVRFVAWVDVVANRDEKFSIIV